MRTGNHLHRPRQAGSTSLALLVIVLICGGLAAGVILPGVAESRAADAALAREQAFQLSESGIDWGIARLRRSGGVVPSPPEELRAVDSLGDFQVRYVSGSANSIDDDGDGLTDEADEIDYVYLTSRGRSRGLSRTIEVVLRRSLQVPTLEAAVQFNVDAPIIDLNGEAFLISGADHDIDGVEDAIAPQKPGMASPADTADLIAQITLAQQDQVQGLGGTPSIEQVPTIDLDALIAQAQSAASIYLEGGNHSNVTLGEPTPGNVVVAYADQDIHFSGGVEGAGILIVDGDLTVSGAFTWRGLVLVRGRVRMTGGGNEKRVIGGVVIQEEITATNSETEVAVFGTVDLLYSSEAIELAAGSLAVMSVLSWQEIANP